MSLPQLIQEDVTRLETVLDDLLRRSEAAAAMIIDKGGFLILAAGDASQFDRTTMAALAAGSFAATQTIATLVQEPNFNTVYQQGDKHSMLVHNIDEHALLIIVFPAQLGVGAIKYFASATIPQVADQFRIAHERNPDGKIDLSMMDMEDSAAFFQKAPQA